MLSLASEASPETDHHSLQKQYIVLHLSTSMCRNYNYSKLLNLVKVQKKRASKTEEKRALPR